MTGDVFVNGDLEGIIRVIRGKTDMEICWKMKRFVIEEIFDSFFTCFIDFSMDFSFQKSTYASISQVLNS